MSSQETFSNAAKRVRGFILESVLEPRNPKNRDWYEIEFNGLARELFALQFEHNLVYRRFCEARGLRPERVAERTEIPAIPTSAFKELEVSCLPVEARTRVFYSSGTTQQRPSRHFHNAESLGIYEASLWAWFEAHLPPEGGTPNQLAILTPQPAEAPHSSLVHMFETVRRKLDSDGSTFLGSVGSNGEWRIDLERVIDLLRRASGMKQAVMLLGTAFSFVHLVDYLGEQDLFFQLPAGSRALETGGYKGRSRSLPREQLHRLIGSRLGISDPHIVCEYGMSELSSQAYDCGQGVAGARERRFHFPPWARAQIISPETGDEVEEGETGLIRVFDLANVYSVMAIQTQDLGVRRGEGFDLIGRAALAEPRGCSVMADLD